MRQVVGKAVFTITVIVGSCGEWGWGSMGVWEYEGRGGAVDVDRVGHCGWDGGAGGVVDVAAARDAERYRGDGIEVST